MWTRWVCSYLRTFALTMFSGWHTFQPVPLWHPGSFVTPPHICGLCDSGCPLVLILPVSRPPDFPFLGPWRKRKVRNCSVFVARLVKRIPIKAHEAHSFKHGLWSQTTWMQSPGFFHFPAVWPLASKLPFRAGCKNRDLKMNLSMKQKQNQGHRE